MPILQAFVATGTNIQLVFHTGTNGYTHGEHGRECDFEKEHGKVSPFPPPFSDGVLYVELLDADGITPGAMHLAKRIFMSTVRGECVRREEGDDALDRPIAKMS